MKSKLLLFASLPFVCGVFATSYLPLKANDLWPCGALCAALILALLALFCARRRLPAAVPVAIFFLCGALCTINGRLGCGITLFPELQAKLFRALKGAVVGVPFSGANTAALLQALLCGDRTLLPASIQADFRNSGAAHILALSGLHLAILSGMLKKSLFFLGHSPRANVIRNCIVIASSGLYTLGAGAGASLVRAFLFICITSLREMLPGRSTPAGGPLLFAAMVQLSFHPESVKTLSFQLSYLACIGIITLNPQLSTWLPAGKGLSRKIWNSLSLSLSCQIFTAPLVYLRFGTLPKYFLLTNLLALPVCELLMNVSVVAIILNTLGVHPRVLISFSDLLAEMMLGILHIIASIP